MVIEDHLHILFTYVRQYPAYTNKLFVFRPCGVETNFNPGDTAGTNIYFWPKVVPRPSLNSRISRTEDYIKNCTRLTVNATRGGGNTRLTRSAGMTFMFYLSAALERLISVLESTGTAANFAIFNRAPTMIYFLWSGSVKSKSLVCWSEANNYLKHWSVDTLPESVVPFPGKSICAFNQSILIAIIGMIHDF